MEKHITMVRETLGATCVDAAVEEGVAGGEPGAPPTYVAMGHLYFRSMEATKRPMSAHREAIGLRSHTTIDEEPDAAC